MTALPMTQPATDAELIARAVAGEHGAFGDLMERYQERVFRMLTRYAGNRTEAEDLTQEVFLKVFRKLHTFQQDSQFYTWVYRIAVNTASDQLSRKSRRRLHLVEDGETLERAAHRTEGPGESADTPLLEEEVREVTRAVLATLPDKYRSILVLREYEDLSYNEISEVLELNLGTVESRLFRARQRFKEALTRMHPELVPQARGGWR